MAAERREHRIALEILYAVVIGGRPLDEALAQAHAGRGVFARGDEAQREDPYEPVYPAVERRADAPKPTDWVVVETIVRGTLARMPELEAQIGPLLERWTMDRLAGVDRLVLDMAAWELRYRPEADKLEIINHACELSRRLSTEKSAAFVNGVLDRLSRTPAGDGGDAVASRGAADLP